MSGDYGERRRFIFELKNQRQFELALKEIEALRAEGLTDIDLEVTEADILARMRRLPQALEILERRPRISLSEYGQALLAGLLKESARQEESEAIFEDLAGRPRLPDSVSRRVLKYLEGKDPERAVNFGRRHTQTAESQRALAQSLRKAGQLEEALKVLEEAAQRFPEDEWLVSEHVMARLEGLPPAEVAQELETVLVMKAHQHNAKIKERLAQAYRKTARYPEARTLLLELLEKKPGDCYLTSNLALVVRELGEVERSLDLFEEVLRQEPGSRETLNAYFSTCSKNDKKARAAAYVALRTQEDPSNRSLWGMLKKYFPR